MWVLVRESLSGGGDEGGAGAGLAGFFLPAERDGGGGVEWRC